MQYRTFGNQLLSLCIMPLRSIRSWFAHPDSLYPPTAESYSTVRRHRLCFAHWRTSGLFFSSVTTDKADHHPIIHVRVETTQVFISLEWMLRSAIARLYGKCFVVYSLQKLPKYFPECVSFYIFTNNVGKIQFLHSFTSIWYCHYFLIWAILILVQWYLIMVLICISVLLMMLYNFHVLIFHLFILFGEVSIHNFCLFSNQVVSLLLSFENSLYSLDISPLSDRWFANIFSGSVSYLFIPSIMTFPQQNF